MHNYKYLDIPIILIIWVIVTEEGKQILAWKKINIMIQELL